MRIFVAILTFLASIALAVYVAIFVLLIGGVTNIADGFKHNPTQAGRIAWGIIEICPLSELIAWLIIWLGAAVAASIGWAPFRRGFFGHTGGTPMRSTGRWPGGF